MAIDWTKEYVKARTSRAAEFIKCGEQAVLPPVGFPVIIEIHCAPFGGKGDSSFLSAALVKSEEEARQEIIFLSYLYNLRFRGGRGLPATNRNGTSWWMRMRKPN